MRRVFRLLPLPLCIAFSLSAYADDDEPPENYALCPVDDAVPFFPDAKPTAAAGTGTPATGTSAGAASPATPANPADPAGVADPAAATAAAASSADQATDIKADSMDGVTGGVFNTKGNVSLNRGEQYLGADNMQFNQDTDNYTADGNVRYQDRTMRMLADRASGNQREERHKIENVRYQLVSRRGNGGAREIVMDGTHGTLLGSTYTTCPPNDRRWELRAPRIDLDTDEGFATARNATVRVGKVPVLYVPWFKFPIDDRRHTGLLYPTLGRSDRNGFDYRQPIYFNLAPNYDMTLLPRLMTKRGFMLGTEFRYLTDTGRGTVNFDFLPSDKLTDRERDEELTDFTANNYSLDNRRKSDRGRFSFVGTQRLTGTWAARANLNWISDPRYFEDFANNLNSLTPYSLASNVGLYGTSRYWDAGITADYYQLADYTLRDANLQYNRLPRLYLNWERPYREWFVAGLNAELTRFAHTDDSTIVQGGFTPTRNVGLETKPGGSRLDLKPSISFPLGGASWFITPTLAYRYTAYELDRDLATQLAVQQARIATNNTLNPPDALVQRYYNERPTRALPIGSLDAGLYFDRQTSFGGEGFLQTLEPRLFYLNAPYRNQSDLPLLDTNALTFSWGQLFRDNRFAGADRQTDANQLTLAMTTRLIRESDGREKLTASLGQILYLDDSRVSLTPSVGRIEQGKSAWVADTNYAFNDRWTVGASYQWDPKTSSRDLASLRTRYLIGDDGIVNFAYRYRRNLAYRSDLPLNDELNNPDLLKQFDLSFLYPISPSWSLVGRYYYSLRDHQLLEGIAGVQWDSCCLSARVVARRYVRNRTGDTNDAIQFEIELKGLGNAGPDTESRLRRAILGYYRDDLYLVPPSELNSSDDDGSGSSESPIP